MLHHSIQYPQSLRSRSQCPRGSTPSSVSVVTFATPMVFRSQSRRCSEWSWCGEAGWIGTQGRNLTSQSLLRPRSPHHWVAVEPLYENQLCGSGAMNSLKIHNSTRANESNVEIPSGGLTHYHCSTRRLRYVYSHTHNSTPSSLRLWRRVEEHSCRAPARVWLRCGFGESCGGQEVRDVRGGESGA